MAITDKIGRTMGKVCPNLYRLLQSRREYLELQMQAWSRPRSCPITRGTNENGTRNFCIVRNFSLITNVSENGCESYFVDRNSPSFRHTSSSRIYSKCSSSLKTFNFKALILVDGSRKPLFRITLLESFLSFNLCFVLIQQSRKGSTSDLSNLENIKQNDQNMKILQ